MIRAVVSLLIVVILGFATTAYLVSFKLRQYSIRSAVKELIKNGAPHSLQLKKKFNLFRPHRNYWYDYFALHRLISSHQNLTCTVVHSNLYN